MDHFGIGNALHGMVRNYFLMTRGTGRTVSLIESVKDGDRVVCTTEVEARRVRGLCAEREVKVDCVSNESSPDGIARLFHRGTPKGRTIFDHGWVEQYYLRVLDDATRCLDDLATQLSGYGEAHRNTKRKYEGTSSWDSDPS